MKQQKTRILTLLLSALLLCTLVVTTMPTQAAAVTQTTNTSAATTKQLATPTLKSVSGSNSGVTVTWGKVTGAAKYRVFRKTAGSSWQWVGDTTALTYTDKTVKAGTKYTYTVRCITKDGKSYTSSYNRTGLTITYTAAPTLTKAESGNGGITVTWNKVAGAAKYRVLRKTAGGQWQRVGDTTALTYTDKTARVGTQYFYTVRCFTKDGKAYTGGNMTPGIKTTRLATPTLTGVKSDNNSITITITWKKVTGAAKYRVFRKTAGGSWRWVGDTTALTYTDKTVKSGVKYTYTVRCVSSDGKVYTSGYNIAGITGQCTHTHNWKSDGTKTITVIDKAAWDEKVTVVDQKAYDEKVTLVCYLVCHDCGHEEPGTADGTTKMGDHIVANLDSHVWGSWTTKYRYETVHHDAVTETVYHDAVTNTDIVHHDAVTHTEVIHHDATTHTETVSTGYTCTRCGAHKD